jgi:hypothetical protein
MIAYKFIPSEMIFSTSTSFMTVTAKDLSETLFAAFPDLVSRSAVAASALSVGACRGST